jgi:tetratricopeptide (TPR) repeat protein/predicted Ser/Thr protein kinase
VTSHQIDELIRRSQEDPSCGFGRYLKLKELGRGAFGKVWLAWDPRLRRTVALKVLRQDDPEEVARFKREALTAAQLSHPNIADVHEVGQVGEEHFIAMRFVEGQTLGRLRLSPPEALEAVAQAARAVHHAHQQGVIHRDLKPENLMRDETGRVTVLDFGLARSVGPGQTVTQSGTMLGTPAYMSPEQARAGRVDPRSDVYGLGATLYDLVTGRPPFLGESAYETMYRVLEQEPVPPRKLNPRLSRDAETIILKALEKNPARRYPDAAALADDIERERAGEPIAARPPSPAYRVRKFVLRRKALSAAVAVGLALAVALVVGWLEARRRELALKELGTLWAEVRAAQEWRRQPSRGSPEVRANLKKAVGEVSRFIEAHPHLPQGYYVRARGLFYLEDLDAAKQDALASVRRVPDFAPGWALLGKLALEQYVRVPYSAPSWSLDRALTDAQPLLVEAEQGLRKGGGEESGRTMVERWGLTRTAEDDLDDALLAALRAYYIDRDPRAARERVERLVGAGATEDVFFLLALWSEADAERLEWLDRAIEIAPHRSIGYIYRGKVHMNLGNKEKAEQDFDRSLQILPDTLGGLYNRAYARRAMGKLDEAIADMTRAIELNPRAGYLYALRGMFRRDHHEPRGAIEDLSRAVQLEPYDQWAYGIRGAVRLDTGDWNGAVQDMTRALEVGAYNSWFSVQRAQAFLELGECSKAIQDCERAFQDDPHYPQAFWLRGLARRRLGETAGAIEDLRQAAQLMQPDSPDLLKVRAALRELEASPPTPGMDPK